MYCYHHQGTKNKATRNLYYVNQMKILQKLFKCKYQEYYKCKQKNKFLYSVVADDFLLPTPYET